MNVPKDRSISDVPIFNSKYQRSDGRTAADYVGTELIHFLVLNIFVLRNAGQFTVVSALVERTGGVVRYSDGSGIV